MFKRKSGAFTYDCHANVASKHLTTSSQPSSHRQETNAKMIARTTNCVEQMIEAHSSKPREQKLNANKTINRT